MSTLYIYYRIQAAQSGALCLAVAGMQARLRAAMPGLAASLHQRCDAQAAGASPTWMEVYHFNGHADERAWQAFEAALARQVATLPAGIDGVRHAERFTPLPLPSAAGEK